jgi:hypothetical protein
VSFLLPHTCNTLGKRNDVRVHVRCAIEGGWQTANRSRITSHPFDWHEPTEPDDVVRGGGEWEDPLRVVRRVPQFAQT